MSINREAAQAHIAALDSNARQAIADQMNAISMMAEAFDTNPPTIVRIFQAAGQEVLNAANDATKISTVVIEGLRSDYGDEWADRAIDNLTLREAMCGGVAPEVDFSQFPALVGYLQASGYFDLGA